jgi:dolichol-phosphate mannosyltransferase
MINCALSVAIPAYLEEENLRILLPRLKSSLDQIQLPYEILVIDTMKAMDNTEQICTDCGIRYVNRRGGNYYGDAVRTAIQEMRGEYVVFMDGDGSHTPEFVQQLFLIRTGNDVVIASRYIDGGATDNSILLIALSKIVNATYSLVLNLQCQDVSNSFKLYRTDMLKKIILHSKNFDIIEEILFKLKKNTPGLVIKEIPFTFKQRMFGSTKRNLALFAFSYLFTLLKLRLKS